ncbi:MAG TPA: methylated-DNA--[protein]-cysteine S-methyltransferase, partial [Solirubrobacteraceae bacterium]
MSFFTIYLSPIGALTLVAGEAGLRSVSFPGRDAPARAVHDPDRLADTVAQLDEYFAGARTAFDLPLDLWGTEFQRAVWAALRTIGYGETTAYGALAATVSAGHEPRSDAERVARVRAVAATIGRTPTAIVVPCHR